MFDCDQSIWMHVLLQLPCRRTSFTSSMPWALRKMRRSKETAAIKKPEWSKSKIRSLDDMPKKRIKKDDYHNRLVHLEILLEGPRLFFALRVHISIDISNLGSSVDSVPAIIFSSFVLCHAFGKNMQHLDLSKQRRWDVRKAKLRAGAVRSSLGWNSVPVSSKIRPLRKLKMHLLSVAPCLLQFRTHTFPWQLSDTCIQTWPSKILSISHSLGLDYCASHRQGTQHDRGPRLVIWHKKDPKTASSGEGGA